MSGHASNTDTLTFSNVNASLGNAVVVVTTVRASGSLSYASSTWNSTSAPAAESFATIVDYGMQGFAQAWTGLSGTHDLTVTLNASTGDLEGVALVVAGADPSDVLSDFDFETLEAYTGANPYSVSTTSTTTANDLVISALRVRVAVASSVAVTPSNGQTLLPGSPFDSANLNAIAFSQKTGLASSTTAGFQFDGSAFPGYLAINAVIKGGLEPGECGGRTPTKYVTVTGAGAQNGNSWASAWTLEDAMQYATDGDIVCIDSGTYTGSATGVRTIPSWNPTDSGSDGDPIIFQARWRATLYGETLRTKLSNGITSGETGNPTFGATGRDWIIWDGVWVDEDISHSHVDAGVGVIWNSTGSQILHSRISGTPMTMENNHSAIRIEDAHDCVVHSNWLSDFTGGSGSANYTGITVFQTHNCEMTNNLIENVNTGIYWKQDNQGFGIGGLIARFNHIRNTPRGLRFEEPNDPIFGTSPRNYVEHNLFQNISAAGIHFINGAGNSVSPRHATIDYNTFVDTDIALYFGYLPSTALADFLLRNNLVDGASYLFYFENDDTTIATFLSNGLAADYNSGRGVTRYGRTDNGNYSTVALFDAATSLAANAQLFSGGATIFTDRSGGDFTLASGSPALTASSTSGPIGCYVTGTETIGLEGL